MDSRDEIACGSCILKEKCTINQDDCFTRRQRWKAVTLAYILPFVFLAGAIVAVSFITNNEYIIGGVALGTLVVYYGLLYIKKPKI